MRLLINPMVDVMIEDDRWSNAKLADLAALVCPASLRAFGYDPAGYEIALLGCNDARISGLNADFRAKSTPTNVLSWPEFDLAAKTDGDMPSRPSPGELGNIAIAYETCEAEAHAQNKTFSDHVSHLLAHGTLHLLGFDHIREKDATLMEGFEVKILASMGIADPY
jgi:probable rRNA maturation factor